MEKFFSISIENDTLEIEELVLHRYSNSNYVMHLPIAEGVLFLRKAIEKDKEEKIFRMWTAQLPFMSKETYVPFEEYCDNLTGKNICRKSNEEIIREAEEIEKKIERRWR